MENNSESPLKQPGIGVTYFLGAGASAGLVRKHLDGRDVGHKMPLVSNFGEYFEMLADSIRSVLKKAKLYLNEDANSVQTFQLENGSKGIPINESNLDSDLRNLLKLLRLLKQYEAKTPDRSSIDTIAKSLWIKDPTSSDYSEMKKVLSWVIWHCQMNRRLDPRYEAFLANILTSNESHQVSFPQNLNIISWNYDLQFEESLYDLSRNLFNALFELDGEYNYVDLLQDAGLKYMKLNGFAGGNLKDKKKRTCQAAIKETRMFDLEHEKYYLKEVSEDIFNNRTESTIQFSWELDKSKIIEAEIKTNMADILVVIGYSFPTFNREIDSLLLNGKNKYREIYVQCGDDYNNQAVAERIMALSSHSINPVLIRNTNEFYIPNNLLIK